MTTLDIVVVNYRTPADLERFCSSVDRNRPYRPFTLWIVNVDPNPADIDQANQSARAFKGRAEVVNFMTNVGYSGACNNVGFGSHGDFIGFFNADTEITSPVFFDACIDAMVANPEWGVLGPRQVNRKGLLTHGGIFGTGDAPEHRAWQQPDDGSFNDVREAVTVSGAAMFVRRVAWRELTRCKTFQELHPGCPGAFLPTRHYYEETFLNYHARAHDWKVMYFGEQSLIHEWHQASPVGGFADQLFHESQALFRTACDAHEIEHD